MLELIREHETLFAKIPPSIAARPPGGARASPSALRQPHLHPSPCLRQLSLPLIAERCREPGQSTSDPQNPRYQRQNFTMQTSHSYHAASRYPQKQVEAEQHNLLATIKKCQEDGLQSQTLGKLKDNIHTEGQ